jgi:hypothetical protein
MSPSIKRLGREPLLHFLILGAGMFLVFQWRSSARPPDPEEIVVTRSRIDALAATFARTWQRLPTATEVDALIREYVRDEVAAREARTMGLDQDDVIVQRRLRQKLEAVAEGLVAHAEPADGELREWLEAHPTASQAEARVTFSQVYLDPERRGDALARDATALLARLDHGESDIDVTTLGDRFLLGHVFKSMALGDLSTRFGPEFAAHVAGLEPGRWHGPIRSGFGAHLVYVHDRAESRPYAFEEVREAARLDWERARRTEATDKFYEAMLQRYHVTIESRTEPGR